MEVKIDGDELTARLNDVKTLWNNMYQDYINGVPESELLTKYFTKTADAGSASIVVKHFKTMTEKEKDHVWKGSVADDV
jgi:alpha-glucuronidase